MKSLATFGFSPHTYLIEDEDLPFEISNQSTQDTLGLLKRDTCKKKRRHQNHLWSIKRSRKSSKVLRGLSNH